MQQISKTILCGFIFVIIAMITGSGFASEEATEGQVAPQGLFKVEINSHEDVNTLTDCGVDGLLKINGGYLVLADKAGVERLERSNLKIEMLGVDLNRRLLAIDISHDLSKRLEYPVIYKEPGLMLYRFNWDQFNPSNNIFELAPILTENLRFVYNEGSKARAFRDELTINLDSVIAEIDSDSVESYVNQLQAFNGRFIGSLGNYACRDWAAQKFADFGYDSVMVDTFEIDYGGIYSCMNVVAYKVGTVYPEFKIIIGAHRDGVSGSPAADDNGSGTAGVLEIARALADYDSKATLIFALYDAEEEGLHGSWHMANQMAAAGDSIVVMLNMDMIGYYQNTTNMTVYHGSDLTYANLYNQLADSLTGINITGHNSGTSAQSDHYPFQQNGYDVVFIIEYIFSHVYHTYQDSTSYMDFDYCSRAVQSIMATAVAADNMFAPAPWLSISYPEGRPNILPQNSDTSFQVQFTGSYNGTPSPGTENIHYSINGGSFSDYDMTPLGENLYEAPLPALECGNRLDYYISVEEASSGIITDPRPERPILTGVGESFNTIFEDDFNTHQGWTVSGSATDGQWSRGIPVGLGERGDPPTDYDGSGYCFLTDNVYGNSDVDGGNTALTSPTFNLDGLDAIIHYARWYDNSFGGAPNADIFGVYISNNDGANWTAVETVGPVEESGGGWYVYKFWVSDFITPTSTMKIMFDASDHGDGSVVEAAVDDIQIYSFVCTPQYMCGDANNDDLINIIDVTYLISFLYQEGAAPDPMEAGDVNNSGVVNLLDVTYLIAYLYNGGPEPVCP